MHSTLNKTLSSINGCLFFFSLSSKFSPWNCSPPHAAALNLSGRTAGIWASMSRVSRPSWSSTSWFWLWGSGRRGRTRTPGWAMTGNEVRASWSGEETLDCLSVYSQWPVSLLCECGVQHDPRAHRHFGVNYGVRERHVRRSGHKRLNARFKICAVNPNYNQTRKVHNCMASKHSLEGSLLKYKNNCTLMLKMNIL